MKSTRLKHDQLLKIFFSLQFLCVTSMMAQKLDFDSLYQNNETYRLTISSIIDTMDLFGRDEIVKIAIESDFKNLVKNKQMGEYQPAILRFDLSDSVELKHQIRIKPRGDVRRQVCYFPPLMLDFQDNDATIEQFKEYDKMKMVVKCSKNRINEQYLLSEYYAYRLLNILTEISFRVKLLQVTYEDTGGKYKSETSHAYIIESIEELAVRLNAVPFEFERLSDKYTNMNHLAIVYLFQYLIGNTDWSIPAGHNINMIKSKKPADQLPYVIPYDFDFAGIVNAHYAVPDKTLPIESVTDRLYRGVCIDEKVIEHAVEQFILAKKEIFKLYENEDKLDKITRQNTIQYISEFYRIIENESRLKMEIFENCR